MKKIIWVILASIFLFSGCVVTPMIPRIVLVNDKPKTEMHEEAVRCEKKAEVREKNQLLLGFSGEKKDYNVNSGMFNELFSYDFKTLRMYNEFKSLKARQEGLATAAGWSIGAGFLMAALGYTFFDLIQYPLGDSGQDADLSALKWVMLGTGGISTVVGLTIAFTMVPPADAETKKALRDTVDEYNNFCTQDTGGIPEN